MTLARPKKTHPRRCTILQTWVKGKGPKAYEKAIRDFKKKVATDGLLSDLKLSALTPSDKKRVKARRAEARRKKKTR